MLFRSGDGLAALLGCAFGVDGLLAVHTFDGITAPRGASVGAGMSCARAGVPNVNATIPTSAASERAMLRWFMVFVLSVQGARVIVTTHFSPPTNAPPKPTHTTHWSGAPSEVCGW